MITYAIGELCRRPRGTTFEPHNAMQLPTAETLWDREPTAQAAVEPATCSENEPARSTMVQALRDLEAAKARVERDARRVLDDTREQLVAKLLPILDDLDRTIRAATESRDAPTVLEGVQLVRSQLEGVLRGYGAERVDARDQIFDPKCHEAVSMIPVADPRCHGRILDQLESGYRFGDRLLRPAKVVVGRYAPSPPRPRPSGWY